MCTETILKEVTNEFFSLYWNVSLNGQPPKWSEHWLFINTIPNQDKRGCYVLFSNDQIIYIGIGIGSSFGKYHGNGLGDRLKRYWELDKKNISYTNKLYTQRKNWTEVTSIMTIGFSEKHFHLAAALEIYLICKLSPKKNVIHK